MNPQEIHKKYGIPPPENGRNHLSKAEQRKKWIKSTIRNYNYNKYGKKAMGKPRNPEHHISHKILAQTFKQNNLQEVPMFDMVKLHTEDAESLSNQHMPGRNLQSKFGALAQTNSSSESVKELLEGANKLLDSPDEPPKPKLKPKSEIPHKNVFKEAEKHKIGKNQSFGKLEVKNNVFKAAHKSIEKKKTMAERSKITPKL